VVTDPHTQTNPQTGPITIHCAAKLSAQCNDSKEDLARSSTLSAVGNASSSVASSFCCFDAILSLDDDDFRLLFLLPVSVALPLRRFWPRDAVVVVSSVTSARKKADLIHLFRGDSKGRGAGGPPPVKFLAPVAPKKFKIRPPLEF